MGYRFSRELASYLDSYKPWELLGARYLSFMWLLKPHLDLLTV